MFSPAKRSEIMSRIRSKDTKAEKIVFKYLNQQNIYYQKHYKRIPGVPDIALPRKKLAVFIDGDFWHGRNYKETIKRLPEEYWQKKILQNVTRDKKTRRELKSRGWKILKVWESDIGRKRTQEQALQKIKVFLSS
jgi:DNA mismatch endonuclease (patch repair protein)